jgi:uncharacterized protein YjbI with pentapeptide repeats
VREALGEKAVRLASHAALPVVVNAELLNLLRENFFLDPPDDLGFDTEASLLLSPLFREMGGGLYEVDPVVRNLLLSSLQLDYADDRVRQVADLLEQYTDASPAWRGLPELEAAQRLTAMTFLDPPLARRWLTEATAGEDSGLASEWYVAMKRRVDDLQAPAQVRDAITATLSRLRTSVAAEERLATVRELDALVRLPGGFDIPVVDELCAFIQERAGDGRVSPDIQAALTLIGTLPHDGFRLHDLVLLGVNLAGLNFSRSRLDRVALYEVDAAGINLAGVHWEDGLLADAVLDGATLDGALLHFLILRAVTMNGVSLAGANISADDVEEVTVTDINGVSPAFASPVPRVAAGAKGSAGSTAVLLQALLDVYPERNRLAARMYTLGERLDGISRDADLSSTMIQVMRTAEEGGWLPDLVSAAISDQPENAALREWQRNYLESSPGAGMAGSGQLLVGTGNVQYNAFGPRPPLDSSALASLSPYTAAARLRSMSHDDAVDLLARAQSSDVTDVLRVLLETDESLVISLLTDLNPRKAAELTSPLMTHSPWLAEVSQAAEGIARCAAELRWTQAGPTRRSPASSKGTHGFVRDYPTGRIYWSARGGALPVTGAIAAYHAASGGTAGPFGYPSLAEQDVPPPPSGTGGSGQAFEGGYIYSSRLGVHGVHRPLFEKYSSLSTTAGWLGFPATEADIVPGKGLVQQFEHGTIYELLGRQPVAVRAATVNYITRSLKNPEELGWPISDEQAADAPDRDGTVQDFENGIVTTEAGKLEVWLR